MVGGGGHRDHVPERSGAVSGSWIDGPVDTNRCNTAVSALTRDSCARTWLYRASVSFPHCARVNAGLTSADQRAAHRRTAGTPPPRGRFTAARYRSVDMVESHQSPHPTIRVQRLESQPSESYVPRTTKELRDDHDAGRGAAGSGRGARRGGRRRAPPRTRHQSAQPRRRGDHQSRRADRIRKGRSWPRERTRAKLEEVLRWPAGTIARIRRGAPAPDESPTQAPPPEGAASERPEPDDSASLIAHAVVAAVDGCSLAIAALPPSDDPEFSQRATPILADLRQLETIAVRATRISRMSPELINALSTVRRHYDELMTRGPAHRMPHWRNGFTRPSGGRTCPPWRPRTRPGSPRTRSSGPRRRNRCRPRPSRRSKRCSARSAERVRPISDRAPAGADSHRTRPR